jgi:hypothetical protein
MGDGLPAWPTRALAKLQHLIPAKTKYDAELWQLAIPALAAMLLDPVMNMMTAGKLCHKQEHQIGDSAVTSALAAGRIDWCSFTEL